jgi:hypothetical protein
MFQVFSIIFCIFLFSVSLMYFSKGASIRAKSRTEFFYASQIREEAETIRLQNELVKFEPTIVKPKEEKVELRIVKPQGVAEAPVQQQEVIELPVQKVELKELELDEKALAFVSKFQPQQEEIKLQEITVYEEPAAWFNFPEVDLHMNERPESGLYYVAGKVMDVLDDMSAIISDGTAERMLYHHKVQSLSVGDIIISQVEIHKSVWNFITVWEVNETIQHQPDAEVAM